MGENGGRTLPCLARLQDSLQCLRKKKTAAGEDRETVRNSAEKRSAGAFKAFRTALILSLTNPKAILFFVAFFVQFIDPAFEAKWIPYLILAAVLQFFSISWLLFLTTLGADALRAVARFPAMAKLGNTAIGGLSSVCRETRSRLKKIPAMAVPKPGSEYS